MVNKSIGFKWLNRRTLERGEVAIVKIIAAHKMLNRIFACSDITIATSPLSEVLCFDHLKCRKEMGGGNIRLCLPALFCISTDIYSTVIISDKQKPLYPISYAPPNQHKYKSLKHSSHLIEQIRNNQTECLASRNSYPLFPTHPTGIRKGLCSPNSLS